MPLRTIDWIPDDPSCPSPGRVRLVDQTRLPEALTWIETRSVTDIHHAIRVLQVRGAPAIGVAAAMGVALAAQEDAGLAADALRARVHEAAEYLAGSRPTAVNLFWALDRMERQAAKLAAQGPEAMRTGLAAEAVAIRDEDAAMCRRIGEAGAVLLSDGDTVLTHCNAGGLATAEYGTALAPVYVAQEQGRTIHVLADETRPLLQGARLTAWELMQAGIDVTILCDGAAAHTLREKEVDYVFVGADRIAANGDAANKIGTYGVALAARAHDVPFYVLAPTSTVDASLPSGDRIPIEERAAEEITEGFGRRTAPEGVRVYAPAFDVTPADLITGIITQNGIVSPPFTPERLGVAGTGGRSRP